MKADIYGRVSRTSLPGLQPKVGLTLTPAGWALPGGGALSTHIVKLGAGPDTVAADVIDTEVAVLDLARRAGFEAPRAWIESFAGARAIVVERFDRKVAEEGVGRIHQEDGAQALGLNTEDLDRKFQRGGRDLPSWRALAAVLTDSFSEPDGLLRLVTFKHAVGDVDFHAKNVSFLRRPDGSIKVAPVYDSAMHMHEPSGHDGRSAIEINGKSDMDAIAAADLVAEAVSWPIPERRAQRIVAQTLERLVVALDEISPSDHPGVGDRAWRVVRDRADRLSAESLKTAKTMTKRNVSRPIRG
ncbi:type II toxin-antitoxin system HipA family toxin [Georgenia ruanii]|nr:HipA domain-containing protein [Georgenia ruanii]